MFIHLFWCCGGYRLFFSFFKGIFKSLTDCILNPKCVWTVGESKCTVFEEQNFERVTVRIDISAVKSLHNLWQQTGISKFTFLFEAFFFEEERQSKNINFLRTYEKWGRNSIRSTLKNF